MFKEDDVCRLFKTIQLSFLAWQFDATIPSEMSILWYSVSWWLLPVDWVDGIEKYTFHAKIIKKWRRSKCPILNMHAKNAAKNFLFTSLLRNTKRTRRLNVLTVVVIRLYENYQFFLHRRAGSHSCWVCRDWYLPSIHRWQWGSLRYVDSNDNLKYALPALGKHQFSSKPDSEGWNRDAVCFFFPRGSGMEQVGGAWKKMDQRAGMNNRQKSAG